MHCRQTEANTAPFARQRTSPRNKLQSAPLNAQPRMATMQRLAAHRMCNNGACFLAFDLTGETRNRKIAARRGTSSTQTAPHVRIPNRARAAAFEDACCRLILAHTPPQLHVQDQMTTRLDSATVAGDQDWLGPPCENRSLHPCQPRHRKHVSPSGCREHGCQHKPAGPQRSTRELSPALQKGTRLALINRESVRRPTGAAQAP